MRREPILVAFAWATAAANARADDVVRPDLVVVGDPTFGMEGGIRTSLSLGQVVSRYDELLPTIVHLENPTANRGVAIFGRFLEEVFIDAPLASLEATFIHEVFGHGARAREFGQWPTYVFSLPEPYALLLSPQQPAQAATEVNANTGQRDRDITIIEAGVEANFLTANRINEQIVASAGWVHETDLDVYLASKGVYITSFLSNGIHESAAQVASTYGGDDVVQYVNDLQDRTNRWRPMDRVGIVGKLQTAYAWNYIDPTLWFSVYSLFVDRLYRGEHYSRLPLPSAGGVTFYPETRFNLSPFGAEHYLEVFLRWGSLVADIYGRFGSSGLASYDGGGARVVGWKPHPWLSFGMEVDAWNQPELLLPQRNVYSPPQETGVNVGLYGTTKLYGALGLTGKLACKTPGYLMGQPLDGGPYGYVGLSITP